ncbi:MAG: RNase adapter RapZ [Elusimicrobia bacterium]|nr:RNase adapter RapZ [Elusimicrobiota bacterium]
MSRLIIITGMSGAGKSSAINVFEDLGFFCVDNLPIILLPKFAEVVAQSEGKISQVALGIDVRERGFLDNLFNTLKELAGLQIKYEMLFLEASTEALLHRFSETRRRHPLDIDGQEHSILEGINRERDLLTEIKAKADQIIDTTNLSAKELRDTLAESFLLLSDKARTLRVNLISFGYKYGMPLDADLVLDVRFLPNPHYLDELKPYTGNDSKIKDFVLNSPLAQKFLKKFFNLLKYLVPHYIKEGKAYLTIAIGCTGGKHRSVVVINELEKYLTGRNYDVKVKHRDVNK